ncbi:MAG: hypothetical protein WCV41_03695, partial [Patescibacteria group bacterium]
MKKFCFLLCSALLVIILIPTEQVKASGTFQLLNFNTTTNAMEDFPFSKTINFLYSGNSTPKVQLVSNNLPSGISISEVEKEGEALYSFVFKGTVEIP